ncbi:alpha/beta fold hydrolase [Legionella sp. W05-934-2]|uniref:bifunctional alpha/beta hydrolase/OsmC family protein n=1 Tax=Legionella sp. W05-934-2 TaxID=1198649 RepID=UPI003461EDFF
MKNTIQFISNDVELSGILEQPPHPTSHYALFAHCFTCGKDILAATRISQALVAQGIAVLRFDFTGLGQSHGEFASTNFSSNVGDLIAAADFLRQNYQAPTLLIGHSLGGAAVLMAAKEIPEVKAIATIGAPASASHVKHTFAADIGEIETKGEAKVQLGPRQFTIKQQFLEDIDRYAETIHSASGKGLLILHSPIDAIVPIEEAEKIYKAAKHPKSYISLDRADHLLSKASDALYVAKSIAAWASHYLEVGASTVKAKIHVDKGHVIVEERDHRFTQDVDTDDHHWLADEPVHVGGQNLGPDPYEHLLAALGVCTAMTIRLVANRNQWPLENIQVSLSHAREHSDDCASCDGKSGYLETIVRQIQMSGDLNEQQKARLTEVADKCPVHKTMSHPLRIDTKVSFS